MLLILYTKGFPFAEVNSVRASERKIICCQFSPDGKHLASGGHDQKLVLWHVDTLRQYSVLEGHSSLVTDVCFNPVSPHFATSSFDKIVRVWDASCLGSPLWTLAGHSSLVMSLDFHSIIDGLLCSCDHHGEIRFWSIKNGGCVKAFKGGSEASQVRFQPRVGRYLAAATANLVSVYDVETQIRKYTLQGHTTQINYLCWNDSGEYLASVSEESVGVWSFGLETNRGHCIHELNLYGRRFTSCIFHPSFGSVLIIGCDKNLEVWDMIENRITTIRAHEGLVAALAMSTVNCLVASASHDQFVKLWK